MLRKTHLPTAQLLSSCLTIIVLLLISNYGQAQTIRDQVQRDTMAYVYKLNNEQLRYIFNKDAIKDTTWFFTNKVDSFSFNNFDQKKLPNGCFLKTTVIAHQLHVKFIANYPFEVRSKSIKNNHLIYLFDKESKKHITNARISVNNRDSKYDEGFGGYVLNILKDKNQSAKKIARRNKYIRVQYQGNDYYFYLNKKNNYIPDLKKSRGVQSSISPGYFIVSQPKFRQLDTVKYKAYLINPFNGKPIRKKAYLRFSGNGKTYWSKKIKRKGLGAYYGQFILPDSLKIDKDYSLQISYYKRGRSFYNTERFRLEDYQLDKNNYKLIIPRDTFNAGEDMAFFAKATDANGFALGDTRLKMKMSIVNIFKTYQDTIKFKKDERRDWYSLDTVMGELEPTKIIFPDNRLLNGIVKYKIAIEMIDTRQEKKKFVRYIYWDAKKRKTIFKQQQDTIVVRHLYELKDTSKSFDLLFYQNQRLLDSLRISTPFKKQLKYNYTRAVLRDLKSNKQEAITLRQNLLNLVDLRTKRSHDSVLIKFSYPMPEPLHYKIYKNNSVVKSGTTHNLIYKVADNSKDNYYLLFTANLNGQLDANYQYFKISQDEKELQIETNFPEKIYPGDKIPLEITVKDYQNKTKENINLTSYAISSMFKEAIRDPNMVSPIAKVDKLKQIPIGESYQEYATRQLSLVQNFNLREWMVKEFNLYKNDFYKIYIPIKNTYTHYIPLDERIKTLDLINKKKTIKTKPPTQFAVIPVLGRRIVRPTYIRIDKKMVYNAASHINLPYSLAASPGKHDIEFRFQDHLIRCQNIIVKEHQKTLLVVNMDSILENNNRDYIIKDSLPNFNMTVKEFQELDENAIFIKGLFFDTLKVYPRNNEANAIYYFNTSQLGFADVRDERFKVVQLPPHSQNENKFVLEYNKKTQIFENKAYSCSFLYDNKVTNKSYDTTTTPFFPRSRTEVYYSQLRDHINTLYPPVIKNAELKKVETAFFEPGKSIKKKYVSPVGHLQAKQQGQAYAQFEISNQKAPGIVAFWLINNENPNKSSFFRTSSRKQLHTHYGGPGTYDIYLLFENKEYLCYKEHPINGQDFWYINTDYILTHPIEKETLLDPILQFNRLTQKPLQPFTNYPDDGKLTAKVTKNSKRKIAQITGILQAANGNKIAYKDIYLERKGRFVQGATTNNKGEFEFLSVPKGNYMIKIFGDNLQPRYAYNVAIKDNAVYSFVIEMKNKNYLRPDLQINENEVRLQIFQSKENTQIKSFANVYDQESRSPLAGVSVQYLSKGGKILAEYKTNATGDFPLYTRPILEKSMDIKFQAQGYGDIILRDVVLLETNSNLLSVFMRTVSNKKTLPLIIKMGLEEKTVMVKATKPKKSDYKKIKESGKAYQQKNQPYKKGSPFNGRNVGGIDGKVLNEKGEPVPFALVVAVEAGIQRGYGKSDFNGNYKIKPLGAGTYSLLISSVGHNRLEIQGVRVRGGRSLTQNITISKKGTKLKKVVIKSAPPLIRVDEPGSQSKSREEISKIASVSTYGQYSTISGVNRTYSYSNSAPLSIGGDRSDGTMYVVDGMMVRGSASLNNIPPGTLTAIPNIQGAITGKKYDLFKAAKAKGLRTNFSNLGYWVPNLVTNKNGKAYATVRFPDDVTKWKTYVVAMGQDYLNGVKTQEIKSYKPVMVNSIIPRFLHSSDKLIAKAKFVNFDRDPHNLAIKISVNGQEQISKNINLKKNYVDSISLQPTSLDSLRWKAELDMDTYYKDGEEIKIPVFRDGLETTKYDLNLLDTNTAQTFSLGENTKTTIYFNNTVLENILVELNKLKTYPYSCNEQKASKIKGLLLEAQVRKKLNQTFDNKRMAKKLIRDLENAQHPNGSWGWWRSSGNNHRMTIYIAEVLHQANNEDYNTRSALLARDYIRDNIKSFSQSDKLYALYLLKKMKATNIDYDKLTKDIDYFSLNACDRLYYISNEFTYKKKLSKSQVYDCLSLLNAQSSRRYYDNFFYDPSANMALAVKLLDETSMKNNVTQSVGKLLSSGKFVSGANTFAKVYLIEAWLQSLGDKADDITASLLINDSLRIEKFPYVYTTTASQVKIKHEGAAVWSSMVQDIYLPDPKKKDSLFDIRSDFKIGNQSISKLEKGKDVDLNIKVMSFRTNKNIMLEVPIPSSCTYARKALPSGNISHIEYYKNKVIYYIEDLSPGDLNLSIPLRVNFGGDFSIPPAQASLMYYPYKSGNNTKKRIRVD